MFKKEGKEYISKAVGLMKEGHGLPLFIILVREDWPSFLLLFPFHMPFLLMLCLPALRDGLCLLADESLIYLDFSTEVPSYGILYIFFLLSPFGSDYSQICFRLWVPQGWCLSSEQPVQTAGTLRGCTTVLGFGCCTVFSGVCLVCASSSLGRPEDGPSS